MVTSEARATPTLSLRSKANEATNLNGTERQQLFSTLVKYEEHFSEKPGKCNLLRYKFDVETTELSVSRSRPLPFAVSKEVRQQIKQLLHDGILEHSDSSYINQLTVVLREGKAPRICVDARKVNKRTRPYHTRVNPTAEILQKFHGSKYISSIDLTSAFMQIELEEASRKYMARLFESEVYQFTRVPYGFRNSLPAFVRALNLTLKYKLSVY
jgi:hypothetical protein